MITLYHHSGGKLSPSDVDDLSRVELLDGIVWIDLDHPSVDEIKAVEAAHGIGIPSADDMREIEVSSRLYQEGAAHVMTASIVYRIETQDPLNAEMTFILLPGVLITVRFATPRAFPIFAQQASYRRHRLSQSGSHCDWLD